MRKNGIPSLLILAIVLTAHIIVNAQTFQWAKKAFSGATGDVFGNNIAVDADGNSYVVGSFSGTASFDGSSTTLASSGSSDILLARYNTNGALQWVIKAGGAGADEGTDIGYDAASNIIYITGNFSGTAAFGNESLASSGLSDFFVGKFDPANGNCIWAVKGGSPTDDDYSSAIAVDNNGNAHITGRYSGTSTFFSLNGVNQSIVWEGWYYYDCFVAKCDADGHWQWAATAGGHYGDGGTGITVDAAGDVYATGIFSNYGGLPVYFGSNTVSCTGSSGMFIAKYSGNGTNVWVVKGSGSTIARGTDIDADADGNIYALGIFQYGATFTSASSGVTSSVTTITYDPNNYSFVKYDPAGNLQWATSLGGVGSFQGNGISINSSDEIFVTGTFAGLTNVGGIQLTSSGEDNVFVGKFNTDGSVQWVTKAIGSYYHVAGGSGNQSGNVYLTGYFFSTAVFGSFPLSACCGTSAAFVTKLNDFLKADNLSGTATCTGASVEVPFTLTGTSFLPGNILTAQLSDASGNFAGPVNIGILNSTDASGVIAATIPVATPVGSAYRIRVVATSPLTIGADNGTNITVSSSPVGNAGTDQTICPGNSATLTATATGGSTPYVYLWSTGAATSAVTVSPATTSTYSLTVTDANGCIAVTATATVTVSPLPVAEAGQDTTIFSGQSVQIGSAPVTGNTYSWTPTDGLSDADVANPIASPNINMTYILSVTNTNNCTKQDIISVNISNTQIFCGTGNIPILPATLPCGSSPDYAPDANFPEETPIKYIKLNVHIIRDAWGGQNFDETTGKQFVIDMVNTANYKLENNETMNLFSGQNPPPNLKTQYRYVLYPDFNDANDPDNDGIYFYNDDDLWFYCPTAGVCPVIRGICTDLPYNSYGTQKEDVINVMMIEPHPDWVEYVLSLPPPDNKIALWGCGPSPYWVILISTYYFQNTWLTAGLLNHEIGHSLGLDHTWPGGDACADTPDNTNCFCTGCSNNMMDYNCSQQAITPCQLGIIHYNLMNTARANYIFGDFCHNIDPIIKIPAGQNIVWNSSRYLKSDLQIEAGAKLTVKCVVSLPNGASIFVEPGATLILDGGVLTNLCGESWEGIEVWGDASKAQLSINNSPQGVLKMQNGAVIENAHEAVRLWDGNNYSTTGGIVQASNSTFRNNSRDVEFIVYKNFNPSTPALEIDNIRSFGNCTFITDAPLNSNMNLRPHVTLWNVHGVKFRGNTFKNTFSPGTTNSGKGIYSTDASYKITRTCEIADSDGDCAGTRNTFEGLYEGIEVNNINSLNAPIINGCEFKNYMDVVLKNVTGATVKKNIFKRENLNPTRLYLTGCNAYSIEENQFIAVSGNLSGVLPSAIALYNTATSGNEIYRNTFTDNGIGIYSLGLGSAYPNGNSQLQIKCNTFTNNKYHIAAVAKIGNPQGTCLSDPLNPNATKTPAGNTFTHSCPNTESDVFNYYQNYSTIEYAHHSDIPRTPQCKSTSVNNHDCLVSFTSNSCSPHTSGGGTGGKKAEIIYAAQQVTNRQTLMGAGNSQILLNAIATQSDGQLKNTLMAKSPYLSDTVLIAYSQTPIKGSKAVSPGNYKQVIIANSPVTANVKVAIDNRDLPQGIRKQIDSAQIGISARAELENEISYYSMEKELAVNDLQRLYLTDTTIENGIDSLIEFLLTDSQPKAKATLVDAYLLNQDTANAEATLNQLQTIPEYQNFVSVYSFILNKDSISALQDDSVAKQQLEILSNDSLKYGYLQARALLGLLYDEQFPVYMENFPVNPSAKMGQIENVNSENEIQPLISKAKENDFVKIYPNPANNSITIDYKLPEKFKYASFTIHNTFGEIVKSRDLVNAIGPILEDISSMPNGVYFYKVIVNNNTLARGKLFVIKN